MNIFKSTKPVARVAINAKPIFTPYGGGNQWLIQMSHWLKALGFSVHYDLKNPELDLILVLHSSDRQDGTFGYEEIREYKKNHPHCKCIHRINENDARKGTDYMNRDIQNMNTLADYTVFVSDWLRQYHVNTAQMKFHSPVEVIHSAADPRFFHAIGASVWDTSQKMIIITHHWSDNWNKGFKHYQKLDEKIASGELQNIELRIIGRWPKEIHWQTAKTFPPSRDLKLANQLRSAHVYITASQAEPGGMHFAEGMQCGLPLLYHSGCGGTLEVGRNSLGIEFEDDLVSAVNQMKSRYHEIRQATLENAQTGMKMCMQYMAIIYRLLSTK